MSRSKTLDSLNESMANVTRLIQRPGYRNRLLSELGQAGTPATVRVLRAVERLDPPGPFIGEVAENLFVDASTATRLIDQAARNGLLKKIPDEADQRRTALKITEEGTELLIRANAVRQGILEEVTRDWSYHDLRQLASLLGRLSEDLKELEL